MNLRVALGAAALTVAVFAARAYAQECPSEAKVEAKKVAGQPVGLLAGCTAPYSGYLYTQQLRTKHRADIAKLDELIVGTRTLLDQARTGLDECRKNAAEALDDCSSEIVPPVVRTTGASWVWAAAGSGVAFAPLAACRLMDCGSEWTPWAVSAIGSAVVVLLARVVN